MRLWSFHPQYLDTKGLLALWREGLLALKVLKGATKGYTAHPQLLRFKQQPDPVMAIQHYLYAVYQEAEARQYRFDLTKIQPNHSPPIIPVTQGQLAYEWAHFLNKLNHRDPGRYQQWHTLAMPQAHPMLKPVPGEIEPWEKQVSGLLIKKQVP